MLKLLLPVLLLALGIGITVATDRPDPPADFTFVNRGDVSTLDPQRMSWMQDLRIARLLYEPLVRLDVLHENYKVIPGVAERWEISDDQTVYTFYLREDAKWSNGEPVTAPQFVYSWRRALLPDTASDYAKLFQFIKGAGEFFEWRTNQTADYADRVGDLSPAERRDEVDRMWAETLAKFDELVGLKALDDRTLQITLKAPTPYWLDLCAFAVFSPVYEPLVSQYERLSPDTGQIKIEFGWTKPPLTVTNGPFVLERWRFKRGLFLRANEHWWAKDTLDIETIAIPSIEDPNAAVLAFETGAVQWVSDLTADYRVAMLRDKQAFYEEHADEVARMKAEGMDQFAIAAALPDDPRKHVHAVDNFATYWYNFNCLPTLTDGRPNPFHDARVRRAFAMVIDKKTIVDEVNRVGQPVANTLIPRGSIAGYTSPAGLKCVSDFEGDPEGLAAHIEEAKSLLAEAGYPSPDDLPVIELLFNKDSGHDLIAQQIARDWQRYLGVQTSLSQKEVGVFRNDLKNANYMTSRAGWYADYADPTTFLELNRTGDGNNDRKYTNPAYDALLDQAKFELDPEKRMALLSEAERIIMEEDLPMVPIFHYISLYLFDPNEITGINPHPRANQDLYLVDVLGDGKGRDEIKRIKKDSDNVSAVGSQN
ncbi:MAG: peptide ABC transporter substrate-binding protein [Planctomycetota bacterium]